MIEMLVNQIGMLIQLRRQISIVKWNHIYQTLMNVAGKDFKVCYNYADGSIYDEGEDATTCDCLFNLYDANGKNYRILKCDVVGLLEGNYYRV